jgi:hypothetical protein
LASFAAGQVQPVKIQVIKFKFRKMKTGDDINKFCCFGFSDKSYGIGDHNHHSVTIVEIPHPEIQISQLMRTVSDKNTAVGVL